MTTAKQPRPRQPLAEAAHHRKTREDNAAETAEDYVEAIAVLTTEQGEARGVDLARRFGVSPVTVINTVARLKREGLVIAQPYRAIFLTEKGRALAEECRGRHELVATFLRAIGVPSEIADQDAEGIEHHVSAETLKAFRRWIEEGKPARPQRGR